MTKKIQRFLEKKKYLHWWVKDKKNLSDESIVYAVLNYGDFDDFLFLLKEMGIKKVKNIFLKQIKSPRNDYYHKTINYFSLYFDKHA